MVLLSFNVQDSSKNHQIDDDGYNVGRDFFVEHAIAGSHQQGMWWRADVEWRTGLMPAGNKSLCSVSSPACSMLTYRLFRYQSWYRC
jgi:hypothetical protein